MPAVSQRAGTPSASSAFAFRREQHLAIHDRIEKRLDAEAVARRYELTAAPV